MIVVVGIGWLLTAKGIGEGVNWIWVLGLGIIGVLTFVLGGFNKASFVVGMFFMVSSCLSLLRQTHRINLEVEVPLLVICIGGLLLLAHLPAIPLPELLQPRSSRPAVSRWQARMLNASGERLVR
jgi:hypothetical protein